MFYQSRNKVSKYWTIRLLIPVKCVLESCLCPLAIYFYQKKNFYWKPIKNKRYENIELGRIFVGGAVLLLPAGNRFWHLLSLTLDDAGQIDQSQELSLDTLGMKVDAIPLETTDDCLIKNISVLEESRDFYWLVSDNLIYKFDKSGHFLQRIGTVGQGPEEYVSAKVIQPVEKERSLYIMDYFGRKMTV